MGSTIFPFMWYYYRRSFATNQEALNTLCRFLFVDQVVIAQKYEDMEFMLEIFDKHNLKEKLEDFSKGYGTDNKHFIMQYGN